MQTIRCAIVEDETEQMETMKNHLHRFSSENNVMFEPDCYFSCLEFLNSFKCQYDIIFFDIRMPGIDGMDAAHQIRNTDKDVTIIFVTSMSQYAIQGYEVQASDYILKPVNYGDFALKLTRVLKKTTFKERSIILKKDGNSFKVSYDDIVYIDVDVHKVRYHTLNDIYSVFSTIKNAEKDLDDHFVKINSGYIVNRSYIQGIEDDCVLLVGGVRLPISRSNLHQLKELLKGKAD